jgi:hypothetical protein
MHPLDEVKDPALASLLDAAAAHYDATAPRVYGAGIPGLGSLGGLDPRAFLIEFFAKQVIGKGKTLLAENKDEIARAVADKARQAVEYLIEQGLNLADSVGA